LVTRSLADALDAAVLRAVQAVDSADGPTLPWDGKRGGERVAFLAIANSPARTPGVRLPLVAVRTPVFRHDRSVTPVETRVGPHYPEELKAASIEGRARVDFVVTEGGRIDPATLRVREFSHPAFAASVLEFLQRTAFRPGLVAGCPVKMLVSQPFEFQLLR
jgi:TonB family protein